jgi:hypothetical protein
VNCRRIKYRALLVGKPLKKQKFKPRFQKKILIFAIFGIFRNFKDISGVLE